MTITKRSLSIAALFLPTITLAGVLARGSAAPVGGLEVKDRDGVVRLKTVEGENGAFSLMLLGRDGKEAVSLGCTATGERCMVLNDAAGRPGLRVGESKEGGWAVSMAGVDSPDVVLKSAGKSGGLEIYSRDNEANGIVMMVDEEGKPRMAMGTKGVRGGNGIYIGHGTNEKSWCMTTTIGKSFAGMQAVEGGAQVTLAGGEQGAWMTCSSKTADLGVGLRTGASTGVRLYATSQRHGVLLEDGGRKTSGIVGLGNAGSILWLGSQEEGMPNTKSPGFYASWGKESGASLLLRHGDQTPSVVLQDIDKMGSGLSVGEGLSGSARVGVRSDANGSIIVKTSTGDVVFEVPNGKKK